MAFLDFIKNRDGQHPVAEQQSQQQKPEQETYKQMMTRQATEGAAGRKSATPEMQQQAQAIGEEMRKGNQSREQSPMAPQNAPEEGGTNSAHRQNQSHQSKEQSPQSPTDDATGKAAGQEKSMGAEKTEERPQQTVARRPPSWEL